MPRMTSAVGSPVASRGEQLEGPLRVRERALDAVRHHGRAQSGDPGLDRGAAVRERDGRGGPIGEREPSLGIGRPPGQRAHPGAEDGDRGEPHQVVVVEPLEPLLEGLQAPAVVEPQCEPGDQPGDGGRLARGLAVEDRRLQQVIGHAPGHRAGVERGHRLGLAALELAPQELAEQVVVAVPLASPVERHDEAVRAHERLERRRGPRGLEHRVAEAAAHPLEHRRVREEPGLGLRQPGQELEAEVLRHQPVVAGEHHGRRRVRRPGLQRERGEIEAGRPALGPLGQVGDARSGRARRPRRSAARPPPAGRAGDRPRRSRAAAPASASGRGAGSAPPCSRWRSATPPERARTARRARRGRLGSRSRAGRRARAPTDARGTPARSRGAGRGSTRSEPPGPDNASNTSGASGSTRLSAAAMYCRNRTASSSRPSRATHAKGRGSFSAHSASSVVLP